ncbi:hypothetical protein BPAE_0382g00070 [Botrytis paeoniae]|uniref:Uncharacterized protein n=1 Tax=Botrytis paeoniae TaxID=278948 RepID=A0A4Z1F6B5_9HELO|nr:hypothetical protein BPAE_0382g00070 [Botrytis paeoniae]
MIFDFCSVCPKNALQILQDESKEALIGRWEIFVEVTKNVYWVRMGILALGQNYAEGMESLVFSTQDTVTEQYNLAAFAAIALSSGSHDWLSITALCCMREAIEVTRKRTISLAPVIILWILKVGSKVLSFSVFKRRWNNQAIGRRAFDLELTQIPGVLAQRPGVIYNRFSEKRWFFCKGRPEALTKDLNENTRVWAKDAIKHMTMFDSAV